MDVPDAVVYSASSAVPMVVPAARAPTMLTPGATMSGLIARLPGRGPRLEKNASRSRPSTAPTVRAAVAAPGEETVSSDGPLFPAAITNST